MLHHYDGFVRRRERPDEVTQLVAKRGSVLEGLGDKLAHRGAPAAEEPQEGRNGALLRATAIFWPRFPVRRACRGRLEASR